MKYCEYCGAEMADNETVCPKCGKKVSSLRQGDENLSDDLKRFSDTSSDNVSPKSRLAAALLAWFLGYLGIHRMYLGKVASGVVMLIFCWTLIPFIIALIDFIRILIGNFKDSEGRELKKW